jgi:hypothetical protein
MTPAPVPQSARLGVHLRKSCAQRDSVVILPVYAERVTYIAGYFYTRPRLVEDARHGEDVCLNGAGGNRAVVVDARVRRLAEFR